MNISISTSQAATALAALIIGSLCLGFVSPAFAAAEEIGVYDNVSSERRDIAPGEVIYRFKNDDRRFRVMEVNDVHEAARSLSRRSDIEYAEPNYMVYAAAVPNDPLYSPYQWHFDNEDHGGVGAEAAWDTARGNGTVVAVVDTGIAYEDYSIGRGWWGESYDQAPDLADTCFVDGYDFINNDTHANDDNAHGTHVAGTIAQSTNNGEGAAGLAYETCLMPVKVLDQNGGGTHTQVANGIYFAADNEADVINLSLGGAASSQTLKDAIKYAYEKGVTIVAASGNDNGSVGYPAAYDDYVIAVGATRYDETRAPYSNYGASLDLVAPGGDTSIDQNGDGYGDGILQQTFNPNTKKTSDFGYYFFQGTSMASPHAAAAAAMLLGNGNATNPDEVRMALQSTAEDLGTSGWDDQFGYGLIDIPAALAWSSGAIDDPEPDPDSPPSVTLTAPSGSSTVSGSVAVTADASDDNGVDHVDFYVDGVLIDSDSTAPYEVSWDSTTVGDGTHTISATAVDSASQEASDVVSVIVDNVEDPNVAPTADAGSDQSVEDSDNNGSEEVTLDGSGSSDSDGSIVSYTWTENGVEVATGATPTVTLDVGSHAITLTVTDDEGATSSDSVNMEVTAAPEPPADGISLSLSGDKDRGRNLVTLEWSGAEGEIIYYYRDGRLEGSTDNDGYHEDNTRDRGSATYAYQVCEVVGDACSDEVSISF